MTTDARDAPPQVSLGRGAMQNWSDHALDSSADSDIARRLVTETSAGAQSCLVVGPHSRDFVLAVAQTIPRVTVLTRSIVDAVEVAEALADCDGVDVLAGSAAALPDDAAYDLVVALDDFVKVASLEEDVAWQTLLEQAAACVGAAGTLVVGSRSELGLDSLAEGPSRPARNADVDWAVDATYDSTRPVTEQQLRDAVTAAGLQVAACHTVFQSWTRPSVAVTAAPAMGEGLRELLGSLCAVDEEDLHVPDHSRIAEAARRAGRLVDLASGWFVVARRDTVDGPSEHEPALDLVRGGVFARFTEDGGSSGDLRREVGGALDRIPAAVTGPLLLELLLRAASRRDLPGLRSLVTAYATWLRGSTDVSGTLPTALASASPGNVLWSEDEPVVLVPGTRTMGVDERIWRSLDVFVEALVAKGLTHPWPSATEPGTILDILAAIAGLSEADRPDDLGRGWQVVRAHRTIDPAVVDRLVEANAALASRASWFEERLDLRERQLRTVESTHRRDLRQEQAKAEDARQNLHEVKASMSFRAGQALLSPARALRKAAKRT